MAKDRAKKLLDALDDVWPIPSDYRRRALRLIREAMREEYLSGVRVGEEYERGVAKEVEYAVEGKDQSGDWICTEGIDSRAEAELQAVKCEEWPGVKGVRVVKRTIGPWMPA